MTKIQKVLNLEFGILPNWLVEPTAQIEILFVIYDLLFVILKKHSRWDPVGIENPNYL